MAEFDPARLEASVKTINCTLALLYDAKTSDRVQPETLPTYSRIEDVVRATDVIDFSRPVSETKNGPALPSAYFREDYHLLPATGYIFQALPGDEETMPQPVIDKWPELYGVVHKYNPATTIGINNGGVLESKSSLGTEGVPVTMVADLKPELTLAMVGLTQFSAIQQIIDYDLKADWSDPEFPYIDGFMRLNQARLLLTSLALYDESGASSEWFEMEVQANADRFDDEEFKTVPAPSHTELGEAIQAEPHTQAMLNFAFLVEGFRSAKNSQDLSLSQIALGVHRLLN